VLGRRAPAALESTAQGRGRFAQLAGISVNELLAMPGRPGGSRFIWQPIKAKQRHAGRPATGKRRRRRNSASLMQPNERWLRQIAEIRAAFRCFRLVFGDIRPFRD